MLFICLKYTTKKSRFATVKRFPKVFAIMYYRDLNNGSPPCDNGTFLLTFNQCRQCLCIFTVPHSKRGSGNLERVGQLGEGWGK